MRGRYFNAEVSAWTETDWGEPTLFNLGGGGGPQVWENTREPSGSDLWPSIDSITCYAEQEIDCSQIVFLLLTEWLQIKTVGG